jgi:hypothetical protein
MELSPRRSVGAAVVAAALFFAAFSLLISTEARAAQAPVGLGTGDGFAVLAGTTVTNTGDTVVVGDLGVDPGSSVTGGPAVSGGSHVHDAVSAAAQRDLVTAYDDAAGRSQTAAVSGDLVGRTLVAGVYRSTSSLGLTGTVTLDAQGDPQAVFVFQIASTLVTGAQSRVAVIGGGQACNVFWQVGSSATLGTGSQFKGSILALTSIAAQTAATVEGRLLARNGAVTLDSNTITRTGCATPGAPSTTAGPIGPTTPAPVPSATPTPTAVPSASPTATVPTSKPTETGTAPPTATPTTTPTAVPTTPSPSVLPTSVTSPPVPSSSALPTTGARVPLGPLTSLGAASLLLGALLVAWGRRRGVRDRV